MSESSRRNNWFTLFTNKCTTYSRRMDDRYINFAKSINMKANLKIFLKTCISISGFTIAFTSAEKKVASSKK